jgi:putative Mg2+ transporter-C (MgtC) family protein
VAGLGVEDAHRALALQRARGDPPLSGSLDAGEIALRLGLAVVAGALIGLDREIKKRPAGLQTHALVALGAALTLLVVAGAPSSGADALSRAVQGIITGIGFVGAGVIMQHEREKRVEGLTTAASIWTAAALGMACGAGQFVLAGAALAGIILVLVAGGWIEGWMERRGMGNKEKQG